MKKIIKFSIVLILSIIAVGFGVYAFIFFTPPSIKFSEELLIKSNNNVNYYDSQNNKVDYKKNGSKPIKIEQLNVHTKQAFIAIEDKNFYSHSGIQPKRIIGATLNNIKNHSYSQGASTISQQLIKNTHLTNEKTLKRKINEIKLTKILEKKYTKDQILEMYLNNIYFGKNCYGIEQASQTYFSKSAKDLDVNESSTLAGIIVAPSKLNPINDISECKKRRNVVLKQMEKQGYISNVNSFINDDIMLNYNENYEIENSYFNAADNQLQSMIDEHPYLFRNCNVYTAYSPRLQLQLKQANPEVDTDFQAMIIDNEDSLINAYFSTCGEIERSPASTVKPWLVYAPCIEEGIVSRYTIINDEKISFGDYSPQNFGDKYYGNVSCEKALNLSLNIPAIKLLDTLTIDKAKGYANRMNVKIDANSLGIALGSFNNGIKLKTLLSAYTTLANDGFFKPPSFIRKITDKNGKILYENNIKSKRVFSTGTATITTEMLKSTAKSGTGRALAINDFEVAVKTGTNGNEKGNFDAYSIAYTTKNTFGVWLGNKDNKLMNNNITGSSQPTLALRRIINDTYKKEKPQKFSQKGVVIKSIDKNCYENNGEILLANDNEEVRNTFQGIFLEGKEPKNKAPKFSETLTTNYSISCKNKKVTIQFNLKPKQYAMISRTHNGETTIVYDGTQNSFSETLTECGNYEYELTIYALSSSGKVFGEPIKLEKIKITDNNPPKIKDDWWNDF